MDIYNKFSTGRTYIQFHPEEIKPKNVIPMIQKLRSTEHLISRGVPMSLRQGKDIAEAMIEIEALKAENRKLKDLIVDLLDRK